MTRKLEAAARAFCDSDELVAAVQAALPFLQYIATRDQSNSIPEARRSAQRYLSAFDTILELATRDESNPRCVEAVSLKVHHALLFGTPSPSAYGRTNAIDHELAGVRRLRDAMQAYLTALEERPTTKRQDAFRRCLASDVATWQKKYAPDISKAAAVRLMAAVAEACGRKMQPDACRKAIADHLESVEPKPSEINHWLNI